MNENNFNKEYDDSTTSTASINGEKLMWIMLGNLSLKQIEERTGISVSLEDREILREMHQEKAENISPGKWHCFDFPFMMMCGDKPTAEKVVKILSQYDWTKSKQALQISWEKSWFENEI